MKSTLLSTIHGFKHEFGTQEMPDPFLGDSIYLTRPKWNQVHGIDFAEVGTAQQDLGNVDAMLTLQSRQLISVRSADCIPLLAVNPISKVAVAIHAGWRGVLQGIVPQVLGSLTQKYQNPSDWQVAIGPHIRQCCFQVGAEVIEQFKGRTFSPSNEWLKDSHIDLTQITLFDLKKIGITEVDDMRFCTRCSKKDESFLFNSYRRDQSQTRQWSSCYFI